MAFFDKLSEVAKNVTERAADGLETNRLTGDVALEKGNIQCYQRELGEFYWAKFALGEKLDDEAMLICDKIVVAQERIRSLEAQIEQIKAEREAEKAEKKSGESGGRSSSKGRGGGARNGKCGAGTFGGAPGGRNSAACLPGLRRRGCAGAEILRGVRQAAE